MAEAFSIPRKLLNAKQMIRQDNSEMPHTERNRMSNAEERRGRERVMIYQIEEARKTYVGASISKDAVIHKGARIYAGAEICKDAEIREGALICAGAVILEGASIRKDAVIHAGAWIGQERKNVSACMVIRGCNQWGITGQICDDGLIITIDCMNDYRGLPMKEALDQIREKYPDESHLYYAAIALIGQWYEQQKGSE